MRLNVLLVEDNRLNADLVSAVLVADGHEVAVAVDGAALRARLARPELQPPDIVVIQEQLPDADGVTLLGELRREPRYARVPALAITASAPRKVDHAREHARERATFLAAGFVAIVRSPFDLRTFTSLLEKHGRPALRLEHRTV